MVKITFKPWEEIVIHESIQHTLDNLVTIQSLGVPAGQLGRRLLWAEGVTFTHTGMLPTEDIIKESLHGRVHWQSVIWAQMPKFKPFIESKTKVKVPVLNVIANEAFSEVAKWLKKTGKKI